MALVSRKALFASGAFCNYAKLVLTEHALELIPKDAPAS